MRDVRGWWRRRQLPSAAVVAWEHAVRSAQAAVDAANRAAAMAQTLDAVTLDGPELVLAVAEVFPHEEGQRLWWESYQRRSPQLQRELVDDLHRRQVRNATGP